MNRRLRLIPQFEKYPKVVEFCQTIPGKLLLIGLFIGLLHLLKFNSLTEFTIAFLLASFLPSHKRRLVPVAFILYFIIFKQADFLPRVMKLLYFDMIPPSFVSNHYLFGHAAGVPAFIKSFASIGVILCYMALYTLFSRSKLSWVQKNPLMTLFSLDILFLLIIKSGHYDIPGFDFLSTVMIVFNTRYVLALGYALIHKNRMPNTAPWSALGAQLVYNFPYGKSPAFLESISAKTETDFAICKIKALKLLLCGYLMGLVLSLFAPLLSLPGFHFSKVFFAPFRTENIWQHYQNFLAGTPSETLIIWWTLFLTFFHDIALWIFWTFPSIAILRFFGYFLPRPAYRAFSARSIPEFFARRYYYYKELLFDFFVLPAMLRLRFVNDRRLRTFLAIFIGVSFGSVLTHLLADLGSFFNLSIDQFLWRHSPYVARALVFGLLIGAYQFKNPLLVEGMRFSGLRHLANYILIIFVFSIGKLFAPIMLTNNPSDNFRFLWSLFKF